jgi:hypothetical protein
VLVTPRRIKLIFVLICTGILLHGVKAGAQENDRSSKRQAAAVEVLRRYVELRLRDADWKDYSEFITWPDEPSWDCHWVVSKYHIGTSKKVGHHVEVPVVYKRLGLFCVTPEFRSDPKIVTIDYQLTRSLGGWKVSGPPFDYPDVEASVLIMSLRASAQSGRKTPEDRAQAEATARKIADALAAAGNTEF